MTPIRGLGEIALRVYDLDSMQKFYQESIGLTLMKRFPNTVFFKIADGVLGHTQVLALFVLRLLTRRSWLAGGVFVILATMLYGSSYGPIAMASVAVGWGLHVFFLFRFGWVAFMVGIVVSVILKTFPLTLNPASWYSHLTLLSLLFVGGLTLWSFRVSLGGRPVFGDILADAWG